MAEFNACARLVNKKDYDEANQKYNDIIKDGKDPFQLVLDLQQKLQIELSEKLPKHNINPAKIKTAGELLEWTRGNEEAMRDEFRELYNAMGQMSRGEKASSEAWKSWKLGHETARNVKLSDFSADDMNELKMEFVDILHFVSNIAIGLGFDSKELIIMYMLKQKENLRRYETNY